MLRLIPTSCTDMVLVTLDTTDMDSDTTDTDSDTTGRWAKQLYHVTQSEDLACIPGSNGSCSFILDAKVEAEEEEVAVLPPDYVEKDPSDYLFPQPPSLFPEETDEDSSE